MAKHVIVISEDAMVREDLEILKEFPNFKSVWERTARVDHVRSVYPSATYPAHTTMMTGVYPDRHGIVGNEQSTLGVESSPWIHFRSSVKERTIFDAAHEAGLDTASVFWPVTGCDPSIKYLIDEYWPQDEHTSGIECFRESGSSDDVLTHIVAPNLPGLVHRHHPECDFFVNACACAMVRRYAPNLLMLHPANIDAYRHRTGLFTQRVNEGLYEADIWLGEIIKATKDAGIYDDTDFFITSDHGQMNIVRVIALNALLAENGFIDVDEGGKIRSMKAFCKSVALSAQVYVTDPKWEERVYDFLCGLQRAEVYGIERVYTAEEAEKEEHLKGDFRFVLESDGYSTFSNAWVRPIVRPLVGGVDYRFGRATHGHLPAKGPQPPMLAFGPDIRPGAVIDQALLVDEAPTFARALNLNMPWADGHALEGLFA